MGVPLIKLKKEVEFNSELKLVIDALKGIAMNRFLTQSKKMTLFERFPELAGELLSGVNIGSINHPYVRPTNPRKAVLMITTDSGFVGNVNSQVLAKGIEVGGSDGVWAVVGERGAAFLNDSKRKFIKFPGVPDQDKARGDLAFQVREAMLKLIAEDQCGHFIVVYPKPISMALQKATVEIMLPCKEWLSGNMAEHSGAAADDTIWESAPSDVLAYVATFWIEHRLDEIFSMSRVSELGARVMHLEGSFQEVIRQGKKIKLQYHRARHEVIDRSMREVFASQLLFGRLEEEENQEKEKDNG